MRTCKRCETSIRSLWCYPNITPSETRCRIIFGGSLGCPRWSLPAALEALRQPAAPRAPISARFLRPAPRCGAEIDERNPYKCVRAHTRACVWSGSVQLVVVQLRTLGLLPHVRNLALNLMRLGCTQSDGHTDRCTYGGTHPNEKIVLRPVISPQLDGFLFEILDADVFIGRLLAELRYHTPGIV
jgi:hypothetical protein